MEIRYNAETGLATAQVTIAPEIIPAQRRTAETALMDYRPPDADDHARICVVPPTGSRLHGCMIDITRTYTV